MPSAVCFFQPHPLHVSLQSRAGAALLLVFLLFASGAQARLIEGRLDRASARSLEVGGNAYAVTKDSRYLSPGHPLSRRNLYSLSGREMERLPVLKSRHLGAVIRVRVRLRNEEVLVVQPVEVMR